MREVIKDRGRLERVIVGTQRVARNVSTDDGKQKTISPQKGSLATVIRGFKSAITKYARERGIAFAWQTRFYDRIVRNQNELNAIVEYIENNPYKPFNFSSK